MATSIAEKRGKKRQKYGGENNQSCDKRRKATKLAHAHGSHAQTTARKRNMKMRNNITTLF